eukprot:TRINITY_DN7479_c0_g1_i1.p1 TRINITY_DN7479_c0_g1~~TRINITY_DN7479_c0_g1_i1.p1  ORF type:complete len:849 (-),score=287.27 TRINITY_DN7479_c0_g1_i1:19-2565(-)
MLALSLIEEYKENLLGDGVKADDFQNHSNGKSPRVRRSVDSPAVGVRTPCGVVDTNISAPRLALKAQPTTPMRSFGSVHVPSIPHQGTPRTAKIPMPAALSSNTGRTPLRIDDSIEPIESVVPQEPSESAESSMTSSFDDSKEIGDQELSGSVSPSAQNASFQYRDEEVSFHIEERDPDSAEDQPSTPTHQKLADLNKTNEFLHQQMEEIGDQYRQQMEELQEEHRAQMNDAQAKLKTLEVALINESEDKKQYVLEHNRILDQSKQLYMAYASKCERLQFLEKKVDELEKKHEATCNEFKSKALHFEQEKAVWSEQRSTFEEQAHLQETLIQELDREQTKAQEDFSVRLKQLTQTIEGLQSQLAASQDAVRALQAQTKPASEDKSHLPQSADVSMSEDQTATVEKYERIISRMEREFKETVEFAEIEEKVKDDHIADLEGRLVEMLLKDEEVYLTKIAPLKEKLEEHQSVRDTLESQLAEVTKNYDAMKATFDDQACLVQQKEAEIVLCKERIAELERLAESLEHNGSETEGRHQHHQSELQLSLSMLGEKNQQLEEELTSLKSEHEAILEKLTAAESEKAKFEGEYQMVSVSQVAEQAELQVQLKNALQNVNAVSELLNEEKSRTSELESQCQSLQAQLDSRTTQLVISTDQCVQLKEKLEECIKDSDEWRVSADSLRALLAEESAKLQHKMAESGCKDDLARECLSALAEKERSIDELSREKDLQKDTVLRLTIMLDTLLLQVDSGDADSNLLRHKVHLENENAELAGRLEETKRYIDGYKLHSKEKIGQLKQRLSETESAAIQLEDVLESVRSRVIERQHAIAKDLQSALFPLLRIEVQPNSSDS